MPGLIDCHVHVTAVTKTPNTEKTPDSYIISAAVKIMKNMLLRGFTTVRDAGGADQGLFLALKDSVVEGPRLFYSGKAISMTGGHGDFRDPKTAADVCPCNSRSGGHMSALADGVDEVVKLARENLRKGATQIKLMGSGGVTSPGDRLVHAQYSEAEIRAVVDEAERWGTYVMAHAYAPEAIQRLARLGVRTIEHANLLDAKTAELMKQHDAYMVPTLAVAESMHLEEGQLKLPEETVKKVEMVREKGLEAIQFARKAGVKVGFGTDLWGTLLDYQNQEFAFRGVRESARDIIHSATQVNASIVRQKDKLGVIKPGAFADLIAVNTNPLNDVNVLANIDKYMAFLMKDGVIYHQNLEEDYA